MHLQKPIRRRTPSCCQTLLIMRIKEMLLRSKCETFSALSLPFKNFPGDVSAEIILIKQPAQAAGLAAYQSRAYPFISYSIWFAASPSASKFKSKVFA